MEVNGDCLLVTHVYTTLILLLSEVPISGRTLHTLGLMDTQNFGRYDMSWEVILHQSKTFIGRVYCDRGIHVADNTDCSVTEV